MKKWLKISIAIVFVVGGITAAFLLLRKIDIPTPIEEENIIFFPGFQKTNSSSTIGAEQTLGKTVSVKKLSDTAIFDFWVSKNTNEVYYINADGKVFIATDGNDLSLNTQYINTINFIKSSPSGSKIIAAFGDPQNPQWGLFDVVDKVWTPLSNNITTLNWGGNDNILIGLIEDTGKQNLSFLDISKNPVKSTIIVDNIQINDLLLYWTSSSSILLAERPGSFYQGRVWQINPVNKTIKTVINGESGLVLNTDLTNNNILKFSNPKSFVIADYAFRAKFPVFFATLPEKCGSDIDVTYCFVPSDEETFFNYSLPEDYAQKKVFSIDNFFAIDLKTEESSLILNSGSSEFGPFDGIKVAPIKDKIYFQNRYDGYLYIININNSSSTDNNYE